MTSDQNMSEVPVHQDAPPVQADFAGPDAGQDGPDDGPQSQPGMGQSKSSRRRRRKRKNKPAGAPGQPAAEAGAEGQPAPQSQAAPQQSQPQPNGQPQGGQQQGGGSGKRWKKKFRDRQRQQVDNPGNAFQPGNVAPGFGGGGSNYGGGGGGFKRKGGKQRKDRSFVGPMDHSYRATNGNFADTPPSTIEVQGNHHRGGGHGHSGPRYTGDSQPIDYSQGRPVPIPEGTPTKIYFFIEDLFFLAKIQETARKLGVKIAFIKNDKEKDIVAELHDMDEEHRPALIVFDLNNASAKPLTLIPKLKAKLKKGTSIVGFLSHIQGDLKAKAVEAGCDAVMPRSAFSQNLPNLLRRYSAAEEEEPNYNQ